MTEVFWGAVCAYAFVLVCFVIGGLRAILFTKEDDANR